MAEEAISALKMLGFAEVNVRKVVKQIMTVKPDTPVEQVSQASVGEALTLGSLGTTKRTLERYITDSI